MKLIITLGAVAVIAGLIVVYILTGNNINLQKSMVVEESSGQIEKNFTVTKQEIIKGEDSLINIQKLGRSLECLISYSTTDLPELTVGTYFVDGGKMRGDFEMNIPELGGIITSSIIFDETTMYSWSNIDGELYGVKLENVSAVEEGEEVLNKVVPADAVVSYECKRWENVDGSVFAPPSEILFKDVESVYEAGMEYGTIYEEGEF